MADRDVLTRCCSLTTMSISVRRLKAVKNAVIRSPRRVCPALSRPIFLTLKDLVRVAEAAHFAQLFALASAMCMNGWTANTCRLHSRPPRSCCYSADAAGPGFWGLAQTPSREQRCSCIRP